MAGGLFQQVDDRGTQRHRKHSDDQRLPLLRAGPCAPGSDRCTEQSNRDDPDRRLRDTVAE